MSLYGRTDSNANKAKVAATVGNGAGSVTETIVFVDEQEAQLAENKARGINGPGWWAYYEYAQGSVTRTKARILCFLTNPDLNTNETQSDDAIAADYTIAIGTQPVAASVTAPAAAQFVVAASTTPAGGTLAYQWQEDSGSGFGDITDGGIYSGATTDTLDLSDSTGLDGYEYRVVVSNSGASTSVTSDAVALTVA